MQLQWGTSCLIIALRIPTIKRSANAFAVFVKSQRKWESAALTEESIRTFKERMKAFGYTSDNVLPHGSYLINMANPDEWVLSRVVLVA